MRASGAKSTTLTDTLGQFLRFLDETDRPHPAGTKSLRSVRAPPADRARKASAALLGTAPWAIPPEAGLSVRLTALGRYWLGTGT